jgi:hypothetical protein
MLLIIFFKNNVNSSSSKPFLPGVSGNAPTDGIGSF